MEGKDFYLEGNELVAGFSKPTRGRPLAAPWQRRGFDPLSNRKLKGRPMRKPRFRMDRAGECALSGRILFWGRFSHGVAMG